MDKHAAYTYLEIAFGVNIVWSTFDDVRQLVAKAMGRRSEELCALVMVLESSDTSTATAKRVNTLKAKVVEIGALHDKIQGSYHKYARLVAFIFAISIPPILLFDAVEYLGNWCGILILPLAVYFALSWLTFGAFFLFVKKEVWGYKKFISKFEGKPDDIKKRINSTEQK